ncbi:Uncharacterised protein r2_g702 [Pycnogonum litorale]
MMEAQERRRKDDQEAQEHRVEAQERRHKQDLAAMMAQMGNGAGVGATVTPTIFSSFTAFDPTSELWSDYWLRFCTYLEANAVPDTRKAKVFLINQSAAIYKQIANVAAQQNPPTKVNELTMGEIVVFMKDQFDPKRFVVRERYKFWSDMQRNPGETLQELAARIRQDAVTCDFPSIKDPQDEALRQRFICSVNNESVLRALFRIKDDELDFARAIQVAIETEEAAYVAKETAYGPRPKPVNKVKSTKTKSPSRKDKDVECYRCGKQHKATNCSYKSAKCHFCGTVGHLDAVCRKKQRQNSRAPVKQITKAELVKAFLDENIAGDVARLDISVAIQGKRFTLELDTATTGNFVSVPVWKKLGKPVLDDVSHRYESASKHHLPVLGTFTGHTQDPRTGNESAIPYIVTSIPNLNLLGRNAIQNLGISVDKALGLKSTFKSQRQRKDGSASHAVNSMQDASLQRACEKLCEEFPILFKPELGCLKDFELDIKFKPDAKPVFFKARPVPFAIRDDLTKGYEEGIAKGVWKPIQFNDYGTPVVPHRKAHISGTLKPKLRICGDYSVGINNQLETHRHPIPLPRT